MATNKLIEDYYLNSYSDVQRSGFQGWGNSLTDKIVIKLSGKLAHKTVLEIGASSGEHFAKRKSVPGINKYVALDLEPGVTDPELMNRLVKDFGVEFVKGNAEKLPFPDNTFDVSLSLCVLAHVDNPSQVLEELRRVTKSGGEIIIGMPCDPGILNRFVKTVITYPGMRRSGISNPKLVYAQEHRNGIGNILVFIKSVFRDDKLRLHYFPFVIPAWNFNLLVAMKAVVSK